MPSPTFMVHGTSHFLVIISAMVSYDWKIGILDESKKSQYNYCFIVKIDEKKFKRARVNVGLIINHWKHNNNKNSWSFSYNNKAN